MIPNRLKKGDTIGVPAPSEPITKENFEEVEMARKQFEEAGFKVQYGKYMMSNELGYGATAKQKAEDINAMFADPTIAAILCAKGGYNSNSTFDYLDYETIQKNPKLFGGFSDITSLANSIYAKTGLVTFSSTNFKSIATSETAYSYQELIKRWVEGDKKLGQVEDSYKIIKEGIAEGILVGGNLNLISYFVGGAYSLDFTDKILFMEDLGFESCPGMISHFLYHLKQNKVFEQIKGLWIGNYEHESNLTLEQLVVDTLENDFSFPIIKSNNFGHTERKTVIPIGTKARMDTSKEEKILLLEDCVR